MLYIFVYCNDASSSLNVGYLTCGDFKMSYILSMETLETLTKKHENILLVDKPRGITSYDVIRDVKRKYGKLKIGHAGTLDPLATGLLIIGIGKGTKRMAEFLKLPKTYEVEILLGVRTDTGDLEGKILESSICRHRMSADCVRKVLGGMVGEIELLVPVYSAVKQKGVPLYKRARRGERVTPPKRKMEIRRISLREIRREDDKSTSSCINSSARQSEKLHFVSSFRLRSLYVVNKTILDVVMDVGSGTYVRSIAEEIGKRLGVPATVKELRRTKVGDFDIRNAQKLDDI